MDMTKTFSCVLEFKEVVDGKDDDDDHMLIVVNIFTIFYLSAVLPTNLESSPNKEVVSLFSCWSYLPLALLAV